MRLSAAAFSSLRFIAKADNPTLAMERDFALLQHLDRLNYSEAWIGEHRNHRRA